MPAPNFFFSHGSLIRSWDAQVNAAVGSSPASTRAIWGPEHTPAHDDPDVGLADVLGGPIGDPALAHASLHVLTFDVVDDVAALIVEPLVLVVNRIDLFGVGVETLRVVVRVEHRPRGGVVDRNPDLHLVDASAPHPHRVREYQRVAHRPVVVLLGVALEDRRLRMPHSIASNPTFRCFFWKDLGATKPCCAPRKSK